MDFGKIPSMNVLAERNYERGLFPFNERVRQISVAEKAWNENLRDLRFFHGTSATFVDSLKANGISPFDIVYDKNLLMELANAVKITDPGHSPYFVRLAEKQSVHVSNSFSHSLDFALQGPEAIRDVLFFCSSVLQSDRRRNLSPEVINILCKTEKYLANMLASRQPMVIAVKKESRVVKKHLHKEWPRLFSLAYDKSFFIREVGQLVRLGESEESAVEGLLDNIDEQFNDLEIFETIPSEDFDKYIMGGELDLLKRLCNI